MDIHNHTPAYEIRLHVDAKKRISLGKLFPDLDITSVRAYRKGDTVILEPFAEVPARELWVYNDPKLLASLRKGLSEEASIDLGSFADADL